MKTTFVEATSTDPYSGSYGNHGKFLVACFDDDEWERLSEVDRAYDGRSTILLHRTGWERQAHFLVTDLQTGEGAIFKLGGYAKADLEKHAIWVCPLFEPFLEWLYEQWREFAGHTQEKFLDWLDPTVSFERMVEFAGHRRKGEVTEYRATITCIENPCSYCRLESGPRRDEVIDKQGGHVYEDPIKALEYGHGMARNVFGASTHTVGLQRRSAGRWEGVATNEWEAERIQRLTDKYRQSDQVDSLRLAVLAHQEMSVEATKERVRSVLGIDLDRPVVVAHQEMTDDRSTFTVSEFVESARIEAEADRGPIRFNTDITRCADEEPQTKGDASSWTCVLPKGHLGDHTAANGLTTWPQIDEDDDGA